MNVVLRENYGPAKAGVKYKVVADGRDSYTIRCQGSNLVVHKCLVKNPFEPDYYNDNKPDEDFIYEDTFTEYR